MFSADLSSEVAGHLLVLKGDSCVSLLQEGGEGEREESINRD